MKVRTKRFLLILASFLFVSWISEIIANWDAREKYHYLPNDKQLKNSKKKNKTLQKILNTAAPAATKNEINPTIKNELIAARGTKVGIPADAFVDKKGALVSANVKIEIVEVIDPIDFVSAGVDLVYYPEKNRREFFQSAGMFKINAAEMNGQMLSLAPGKKLEVQFPNIVPGDEFFVYRQDARQQWELHGHNQSTTGKEESRGGISIGTRRYNIDALNTWWNFDKPVPHAACAKGSVQKTDGNLTKFTVYSIGISVKGSFARYIANSATFKVNVHKSTRSRFMVIDDTGALGISPEIQITDKTGFDQAEEGPQNFCQDIGVIKIAPVPDEIASDKRKLSEFLGLPISDYKVDYQVGGTPTTVR